MQITVGKYTTRDGRKAVVRHVETELAVDCNSYSVLGFRDFGNDNWVETSWKPNGSYFQENSEEPGDIVSVGWPLTFTPGRWYETRVGSMRKFVGDSGIGERPLLFVDPDGDVSRRHASGRYASAECGGDIIAECEPPECEPPEGSQ